MVGSGRRFAAVAIAGVVATHALDFVLVYPGVAHREHHLAATGHGYWPAAVVVALLAAVLAVAAAALRGGTRGVDGTTGGDRSESVAHDIARVAVVQAVLFASVEVSERIVAGIAPATLVQAPEFLVGLVLQLVVAAVAVLALLLVERLSEKVVAAAAAGRRRSSSSSHLRGTGSPVFIATTFVCAARPRAPPNALA